MFMCRSLEEFREGYLRLMADVQPQPPPVHYERAGPSIHLDPGPQSDSDSDAPDRKRYRLVVKRERY